MQPSKTQHVATASQTFLFDRCRSGRMKFAKGSLDKPILHWETRLPNSPPHSPESTSIFDSEGNLYFGCHDGNFYSLDSTGKIRWVYKTDAKIYSSPCFLENDSLCFASGDGYLYCLSISGDLLWRQPVGRPLTGKFSHWVLSYHRRHSHVLHEVNRIASALSWSSPNQLSDGLVLCTGYELGLQAFDGITGKLEWSQKLSAPRAHLAGAAVTVDDVIFVAAQQGPLFCVNGLGHLLWKRRLAPGLNVWGNPSIDETERTVYVPCSRREVEGQVFAFDYSGRLKWKSAVPGGLRGSITISRMDYVVVCGYDGWLRFLDKRTGRIVFELKAAEEHLWTSCGIDRADNLFVATIDSDVTDAGRLRCISATGRPVWDVDIGKGHSVPVLDSDGKIYVGSWRGVMMCYQT